MSTTPLIPPNAMIIPVDTRTQSKTIFLPDVATNPGRFLIFKDVYGTSALSSIYISTVNNNYFEQSWCNVFVANSNYGAWHLTNDTQSRWFFVNMYTKDDFYIYKQTDIIREGLVFNYEGYAYSQGPFWVDYTNRVHLSSGIGLAQPSTSNDLDGYNVVSFNGRNQYFRSFTGIDPFATNCISTHTYSIWFSNNGASAYSVYTEAASPSSISSSVLGPFNSQTICYIFNNQLWVGYRTATGGNFRAMQNFSTSKWNNVTWTVGNSTLVQYVNGFSSTQVITNNTTYRRSTQEFFYPVVGMGTTSWNPPNTNTCNQYSGLIGSIRLYSTVLTRTQVIQNYNAECWRYGTLQCNV